METIENGSVTVWQSMTSPLYLFELLYIATFQLKMWYYLSALADDLIRLTNNDKEIGKVMFIFLVFVRINQQANYLANSNNKYQLCFQVCKLILFVISHSISNKPSEKNRKETGTETGAFLTLCLLDFLDPKNPGRGVDSRSLLIVKLYKHEIWYTSQHYKLLNNHALNQYKITIFIIS